MTDTDALVPEIVDSRPPSDLLVLAALEQAPQDLTRQELEAMTRLARGTCKEALHRLVEDGLVERRPVPHDARRWFYGLA